MLKVGKKELRPCHDIKNSIFKEMVSLFISNIIKGSFSIANR